MRMSTTYPIIFASHNQHKFSEIRHILPDVLELKSLTDVGFFDVIEEPYDTFFENAEIKAKTIYQRYNTSVFSEDSGLVVEALDGRPGVFSARYAGEPANDLNNLNKVLLELEGVDNRKAYYLSHICLIWNGEVHHFEGYCRGYIHTHSAGEGGFGYDPIFIPEGYTETFGQLDPDIKSQLSHRTDAFNKMLAWLLPQL